MGMTFRAVPQRPSTAGSSSSATPQGMQKAIAATATNSAGFKQQPAARQSQTSGYQAHLHHLSTADSRVVPTMYNGCMIPSSSTMIHQSHVSGSQQDECPAGRTWSDDSLYRPISTSGTQPQPTIGLQHAIIQGQEHSTLYSNSRPSSAQLPHGPVVETPRPSSGYSYLPPSETLADLHDNTLISSSPIPPSAYHTAFNRPSEFGCRPHSSAHQAIGMTRNMSPPKRDLAPQRPSTAPKPRHIGSLDDLPPLPVPRALETSIENNRAPKEQPSHDHTYQSLSNQSRAVHAGPLIEMSGNAKRLNSAKDADYEIVDQHGAFLSKPGVRPSATDHATLAAYAGQTPEERMRVLDNFICENIGNEDFLTLCEDVDACWRRIGLGL